MASTLPSRRERYRSAQEDIRDAGYPHRTRMARELEFIDRELRLLLQDHKRLPDYHEPAHHPKRPWWTIIAAMGKEGIDLVRGLLRYDPSSRISASQVRADSIFSSAPLDDKCLSGSQTRILRSPP